VPDPSGKSALSTHYIRYDVNGLVAEMVDANGNKRKYTYGTPPTSN
jgi:hypothetical protein